MLSGVLVGLATVEVLLRLYVIGIPYSAAHRVHLVYTAEGRDVVLGDSHAKQAFLVDRDFTNLAVGGSTTSALAIVAEEYFRFRKPGRVIVQAGPHMFPPHLEAQGTQGHEDFFGQNVGLGFALYVFEPGVSRNAGSLLHVDRLLDRAAFERLRAKPDGPFERQRWHRMETRTPEETLRRAHGRLDLMRPQAHFERTHLFADYQRMIDRLVERGARVCMVEFPLTPLLAGLVDADPAFARVRASLERIAAAHDLRYVRPRDVPVELEEHDFVDLDHLGATGAGHFTKALIERCFEAGAHAEDAGAAPARARARSNPGDS